MSEVEEMLCGWVLQRDIVVMVVNLLCFELGKGEAGKGLLLLFVFQSGLRASR